MTDTNCFTNLCKYICRFEELDIPKDWNTAKPLCSMIIFHAYTTWSFVKQRLKTPDEGCFSVKKTKNKKPQKVHIRVAL